MQVATRLKDKRSYIYLLESIKQIGWTDEHVQAYIEAYLEGFMEGFVIGFTQVWDEYMRTVTINLIRMHQFSDADIASVVKESVTYVQGVRQELEGEL